ncbi:MAG: MopE-related protein [Myxococcota bacterium]
MLSRGSARPSLVALLLASLAGCDCGALLDGKRFACQTDADCVDGYVCRSAGAGLECIPADDGGTGGGDAGAGDGGVDLDGDGVSPPEDCDDTRPDVKPGVMELCADFRDNDCDQQTDCADSQCGGRACGTTGSACVGPRCAELACSDASDNDGDGATDCADSDCAGQSCGVGGTCMNGVCRAPTEANLCADGLDNDGDSLIDCADNVDCPSGSTCSDSNACTVSDMCIGAGGGSCAAGAPLMCVTPPNPQCFAPLGVCLPDAGVCRYTVNPGANCDDGSLCTKNDTCTGDGGCAGTPACDSPPSVCHQSVGACSEVDGRCTYPPRASGSCDDNDACTFNDTCDGDGGCAGTRITCVSPSQCHRVNGCTADGGCLFTVATGQVCDAGTAVPGTCNPMGTCVGGAVFPFSPSNFTEAQLPAHTPPLTFNCGVTTVNTGVAGGAVTWTNNCATNPSNVPYTELSVGSQQAVLLHVDALSIGSMATLRAEGRRSLIIAVRGSANIQGTLDVGSTAASVGAGAVANCMTGRGGAGASNAFFGYEVAGGGGGGAFGSAGGTGGLGGGSSGTVGGVGGAPEGAANLIPLRGGCPGGEGGSESMTPAAGGSGGGAIQLTVAGTLSLSGRVTAYGAGGAGGMYGATDSSGGGGGGSGGAILLEAGSLSLLSGAVVTANGGGGGQGGPSNMTSGAAPGGSNGAAASATPAAGGRDNTLCGGFGGAGGAASTPAAAGAAEMCATGGSGGGGGGGVGRIFLRAAGVCSIDPAVVISPPALRTGCP